MHLSAITLPWINYLDVNYNTGFNDNNYIIITLQTKKGFDEEMSYDPNILQIQINRINVC
jgi:hypothetical protein